MLLCPTPIDIDRENSGVFIDLLHKIRRLWTILCTQSYLARVNNSPVNNCLLVDFSQHCLTVAEIAEDHLGEIHKSI